MYKKDYEESRIKELKFESFLKDEMGFKTETTDPAKYFPYWDISSTGCTCENKSKVTRYEVKYLRQNKTIYIENGQMVNGKLIPCGLSITKANFYVFTFKDDEYFYLISVKKLKELVNQNTNIYFDKNSYQLSVFPAEEIINYCKVYGSCENSLTFQIK